MTHFQRQAASESFAEAGKDLSSISCVVLIHDQIGSSSCGIQFVYPRTKNGDVLTSARQVGFDLKAKVSNGY